MAMPLTTVRWRLNDPAEEARPRWTKVHLVSYHASDLTACHMLIPEQPYMMDWDRDVSFDAVECKRCRSANE